MFLEFRREPGCPEVPWSPFRRGLTTPEVLPVHPPVITTLPFSSLISPDLVARIARSAGDSTDIGTISTNPCPFNSFAPTGMFGDFLPIHTEPFGIVAVKKPVLDWAKMAPPPSRRAIRRYLLIASLSSFRIYDHDTMVKLIFYT